MAKFKERSKVRLKEMTMDEFELCDTGAGMLTPMFKHVGEIHTVQWVSPSGNYSLVNPDGEEYFYSPNWLEPARVFKGNK